METPEFVCEIIPKEYLNYDKQLDIASFKAGSTASLLECGSTHRQASVLSGLLNGPLSSTPDCLHQSQQSTALLRALYIDYSRVLNGGLHAAKAVFHREREQLT